MDVILVGVLYLNNTAHSSVILGLLDTNRRSIKRHHVVQTTARQEDTPNGRRKELGVKTATNARAALVS